MVDNAELQHRISSVMDDPGARALAHVYGEAYLNAIPEGQVADYLEEFESFLSDVVEKFPEFSQALLSGMVSRDNKLRLLQQVTEGRASEIFASFLQVLARHERLPLLPAIYRQCLHQQELRTNHQRVQVTSARTLSEQSLESLTQKLGAALPFQPIIEARVDPSLIGGLHIRVGDTVYDGSLRTRLKQLQARLRERSSHEIQSGRNRFSHSAGN